MSVRVRFAPSPTGYLHIGGVRTALFNWVFARHEGGTFILRIEDTDRERSTDESIRQILEGMHWIGLDWDEGPNYPGDGEKGDCGPYRQTARHAVYQQYAKKLLDSGHLYRCYCTPEELEQRRKEAEAAKKTFRYDGRCREKGAIEEKPFTLRLRTPEQEETIVHDVVRGEVRFQNQEIGDWICVRSNGDPTYNFCVVVDDVTMKITHVIRGDDHLNNTPKQIHLFEALQFPLPIFAHLPMILGQDRKGKLSKRSGAASVLDFREGGFLPEASLNYLARLCWSHGDQEIFTKQELVEKFSLDGIGKSSAAFDMHKLTWVNAEHMKKLDGKKLLEAAQPFYEKRGLHFEIDAWALRMVELFRERAKTLDELAQSSSFFFQEMGLDPKDHKKFLSAAIEKPLKELIENLENLTAWTEEKMKPTFEAIVQKHDFKLVALAQAARVSITGTSTSPPIFAIMELLGKEKSLDRMKRGLLRVGEIDSAGAAEEI